MAAGEARAALAESIRRAQFESHYQCQSAKGTACPFCAALRDEAMDLADAYAEAVAAERDGALTRAAEIGQENQGAS